VARLAIEIPDASQGPQPSNPFGKSPPGAAGPWSGSGPAAPIVLPAPHQVGDRRRAWRCTECWCPVSHRALQARTPRSVFISLRHASSDQWRRLAWRCVESRRVGGRRAI